jgi:superfamily I DNA and RNA helicase
MINIPTTPKQLSALKRRTMAQLQQKKQSSKFTDEQIAAINGVVTGTGHVSIKALAGTGKTHTLVECANRLAPTLTVAAVAYNRSIADELKTRMPAHVDCVTAHSLGKKAPSRCNSQ